MKNYMSLSLFLILFSMNITQGAEQQDDLPKFGIPIEYKLYFDNAVTQQDIETLITLLMYPRGKDIKLRDNYPFAMKLYRILMEYSPGEDFSTEAQYIPIKIITNVAKELAIAGSNDRFLKNMPR